MTQHQSAPRAALDLTKTAWTRVKGDVTVYATWILTTGRPCLVLLPTNRLSNSEHLIPCLVPLDMAYLWDEHVGDPVHCARTTVQFAQALGINEYEPRNLIRLTSIIREHLGDLLTMPPLPDEATDVVADAILTDPNTGKTREKEITDHV